MPTARTLQRLHIALIAVLVFGGLGGWAMALAGGHSYFLSATCGSWAATSVLLAVLGHRVERGCGGAKPGWPALAFWGAVPLVRIIFEVHMVTRMALVAGAFLEDDGLARRAQRLVIARAVLSVVHFFAPLLIWSLLADVADIVAPAAIGLLALSSIALLAVATHLVVAPLADKLTHAGIALGGAGVDAPVAVSTVR